MTVGLIGTGRMAAQRLQYVGELADHEIRWVCSRELRRAKAFLADRGAGDHGAGDHGAGKKAARAQNPDIEVVSSLEEGIERLPVDAIIDTSPNALHRRNAQRAFDAGCHLFVEYPHACTVEDGRWMIEAAERAGVSFHVGLTHRFGARHELMARVYGGDAKGAIGLDLGAARSYSEVICSGNPISRWFDDDSLSGGMFVASMYHFIDQACSYFGDPTSLRASYGASRDEAGVIHRDSGHAILGFAEGRTIVNIAYSRGFEKPGLGSRTLVVFDHGYLERSGGETIVRTPDGERTIDMPEDDAMRADTRRFFECASGSGRAGGRNKSPEWAQASLQVACSLQEDAGLTAGRKLR